MNPDSDENDNEGGVPKMLANEAQLLAEERWIVRALTKIHEQRNNLQVERLHLHSIITEMLQKDDENKDHDANNLALSAVALMHQMMNQEVQVVNEICQGEELNLTVPQHPFHDFHLEEEEYASVEVDDYEIDMNMFMNGKR